MSADQRSSSAQAALPASSATASRTGPGSVWPLASAATFGISSAFAKALLTNGWSPGAVVTARMAGAALVLLPVAVVVLRGRWRLLWRNARFAVAYGLVAVALCQFAYFNAVERLSVAVALLLEYLAPVLIVGYLWVRGARPNRLTLAGVVLAVSGLLLVLDVFGGVRLSVVGVLWGLAAAGGLVGYFLLCPRARGVAAPAGARPGRARGRRGRPRGRGSGRAPAHGRVDGRRRRRWSARGRGWVPVAEPSPSSPLPSRMPRASVPCACSAPPSPPSCSPRCSSPWPSPSCSSASSPALVQVAGGLLIVAGVVAVRLAEVRVSSSRSAASRCRRRGISWCPLPVP